MSTSDQAFSYRASFFYGGVFYVDSVTVGGTEWQPGLGSDDAGDAPVVLYEPSANAPLGRTLRAQANGVVATQDPGAGVTRLGLGGALGVAPTQVDADLASSALAAPGVYSGTATSSLLHFTGGAAAFDATSSLVAGTAGWEGGAVVRSALLGPAQEHGAATDAVVAAGDVVAAEGASLNKAVLLGRGISYLDPPEGLLLLAGGSGAVGAGSAYADGSGRAYVSAATPPGAHVVGRPNVRIASMAAGETRFEGRPLCSRSRFPEANGDDLVSKGYADNLAAAGGSLAQPVVMAVLDGSTSSGRLLEGEPLGVEVTDGGPGATIALGLSPALNFSAGAVGGTHTGSLLFGPPTVAGGSTSASIVGGSGLVVRGTLNGTVVWGKDTEVFDYTDGVCLGSRNRPNSAARTFILGSDIEARPDATSGISVFVGHALRYGNGLTNASFFLSGGASDLDADSPYAAVGETYTYVDGNTPVGTHIVGRHSVTIASMSGGATTFEGRPVCDTDVYPSEHADDLVSKADLDSVVETFVPTLPLLVSFVSHTPVTGLGTLQLGRNYESPRFPNVLSGRGIDFLPSFNRGGIISTIEGFGTPPGGTRTYLIRVTGSLQLFRSPNANDYLNGVSRVAVYIGGQVVAAHYDTMDIFAMTPIPYPHWSSSSMQANASFVLSIPANTGVRIALEAKNETLPIVGPDTTQNNVVDITVHDAFFTLQVQKLD